MDGVADQIDQTFDGIISVFDEEAGRANAAHTNENSASKSSTSSRRRAKEAVKPITAKEKNVARELVDKICVVNILFSHQY